MGALGVLAIIVLIIFFNAVHVLPEYVRAVVFTLGRLSGVRGPGLIIVIPFIQKIVRIDTRTIAMDVPSQDVITRDNISIKVNAVLYYRVVDPAKADPNKVLNIQGLILFGGGEIKNG